MSIVVALHVSRRLKRNRRRARTNRTNNCRGESRPQSSQLVITFNTKFCLHVEVARDIGWLSQPVISCPPGVNARIPRLLQWPGKESVHEVIAWVWGSVGHENAREQYSWALSVLIRTLPEGLTGVQIWKHRAYCWACRVAMLSVGWFRLIQDMDTSLVVFLRGTCLGLGPPQGGIVCGLFSKEAFFLARHLSVVHTLQIWLHVSQNISGACIVLVSKVQPNPGIEFSGASCGEVRAPPPQWAELEVPLEAAVGDGDVLLADDREANKAWCVDRQEFFL